MLYEVITADFRRDHRALAALRLPDRGRQRTVFDGLEQILVDEIRQIGCKTLV